MIRRIRRRGPRNAWCRAGRPDGSRSRRRHPSRGLDAAGFGSIVVVAYDPDNIFARILRGEAEAHVVLDEPRSLAFMDVMPQSPGHTLIIPKEPVADIFDIGADALAELIGTTQRVARAVRKAFTPSGVMVMQLNGAHAGQTVFHLHFHVVPRYAAQSPALHARAMAKPETLSEHAARIRAALEP